MYSSLISFLNIVTVSVLAMIIKKRSLGTPDSDFYVRYASCLDMRDTISRDEILELIIELLNINIIEK